MINYPEYADYLSKEKNMSQNTQRAYIRDIKSYGDFIQKRGVENPGDAASTEVMAYLIELRGEDMSRATLSRKLASLRAYYRFLVKKGIIRENPVDGIKVPRVEKKEIEYISIEDIDRLMQMPKGDTKGIRDRAILEMLYATGMRASELIQMRMDDLNLRMGFVKCTPQTGKARIIPMGKICRKAIENYCDNAREILLRRNKSEFLFVNYAGKPITRQGLWKVLKEYGEAAGLPISLTPQVIRNSFAVHMLQNGADVKSLQELMGHEDISATQAYLAVVKNRIKDVYDRAHPRA